MLPKRNSTAGKIFGDRFERHAHRSQVVAGNPGNQLGALSLTGNDIHTAPAEPVTVVDPVGAGDAFVAGYLSEVVAHGSEPDRLRRGNTLGAAVCAARGDWEGLPTRAELNQRPHSGEVLR